MSAEHFREHGYLLCERVFETAEVEEMRDALERILEMVAGTKHDENHAWSGVSQDSVLKGFHNIQYHDAAFTLMTLGHAAGLAAAQAARRGVAVQDIDVVALQETLRNEGQVLAA